MSPHPRRPSSSCCPRAWNTLSPCRSNRCSRPCPHDRPRVVFAGGGSGGHIFPALAIDEELRRLAGNDTTSVFVCSDRALDEQIMKREKVAYRVIPAKPISTRPRGLIRFLMNWGPSVRAGRSLIRELRGSHDRVHVVAMGGFVAAPIARAARSEHVPVTLVNMDAVPGKANRLIARSVKDVVSCVPVVGPCARLDWPVVPPIVRPSALASLDAAACRRALGLEASKKTLLVTGGSQGAVTINRTVLGVARAGALAGWQVIHQIGRGVGPGALGGYQD